MIYFVSGGVLLMAIALLMGLRKKGGGLNQMLAQEESM